MTNILALQGMDVSYDDEGPLSEATCLKQRSNITLVCSASSNTCDVAGMGEHYF